MAQAQKKVDNNKPSKTPEAKEESLEETEVKEEDEFIGYYERPKVLGRYEYGKHKKLELIELQGSENLKGSTLIVGFAGIGTTSTVVSAFLIGEKNLPLVAVFQSAELAALCSVHKYQATASLRIYGDNRMCVCVGDLQLSAVSQAELIWTISEALIDFARRHNCTHIVAVDGFPIRSGVDRLKHYVRQQQEQLNGGSLKNEKAETMEDQILKDQDAKEPNDLFLKVGYLSNNKDVGIKLKNLGHKAIKTGQIIGVTGALLAASYVCNQDDPPLTVLLAPDPVQIPDQRGALLAVKLIRELFGFNEIKIEQLEVETKRLATKIDEAIKDVQAQITRQFQQYLPKQPPSGMYS